MGHFTAGDHRKLANIWNYLIQWAVNTNTQIDIPTQDSVCSDMDSYIQGDWSEDLWMDLEYKQNQWMYLEDKQNQWMDLEDKHNKWMDLEDKCHPKKTEIKETEIESI